MHTRRAFAAVLLVIASTSAFVIGDTSSQNVAVETQAPASITGRVFIGDSAHSARGARVTLSHASTASTLYAFTDDNGTYRVSGVAAGQYSVRATKEGFVPMSYGQRHWREGGRLVTVGSQGSIANIDIVLQRGGVIAGTIVDESGDAIVNAAVSAMQPTFEPGRMTVVGVQTSGTDDLGNYRLIGLAPGAYYVSVRRRSTVPLRAVADNDFAHSPVYAPGTSTLSDAQRVDVRQGEVSHINVTAMLTPMAAISGVAIGPNGSPMSGGSVHLRQPNVQFPAPLSMKYGVERDGRFTITGVPPGTFEVRAVSARLGAYAVGTVAVDGRNVEGLQLRPVTMARVSGRVIVEPASDTLALVDSGISVDFRPTDPTEDSDWRVPDVRLMRDGGFSTAALPGRWLIRASLPRDWVVSKVIAGGLDATIEGFQTREGQETRDVEVEVSRSSTILGRVLDAAGQATGDCTVLCFAKDPRRRNSEMYYAVTRPDQFGDFVIGALAPGDYFAVAIDYADLTQIHDPAVLERLSGSAVTFTLRSGERRTMSLRVAR